jgi:hypothetical protein
MLQFKNLSNKLDNVKTHINTVYPVYISMTTIPPRLENTLKIIKNTLKHMDGIEKIILNIPIKWKNFSENKQLNNNIINDTRFKLNIIQEDYGPITKIIPTLDITPKECILIVCDDECYHHEAYKFLAEKQDKHHDKTFTYYKYNYDDLTVPQGVDMISFWKPNLDGLRDYWEKTLGNEYCFYVDDLVIGGYLRSKGVEVVQEKRKWKWPFIPNCLEVKDNESLYNKKGKYSRNNSMKKCMLFLS